MLDQLSERLQKSLNTFSNGQKSLEPEDLDLALRDVRRALLEADVNLRAIQAFLTRIKNEALGQDILKGLEPQHQLVSIVNDALVDLLGKNNTPLALLNQHQGDLGVILLFGLQGSGKTTTAAKLARWLNQLHGKKVLLVAADTVRPAAIDQLITLGERVARDAKTPQQVQVHHVPGEMDMSAIAASAFERARTEQFDAMIIDTAGRQHVEASVMAQLVILERSLMAKGWITEANPLEKLLVIDAMTGQEAVNVAAAFEAQIGLTGLVMTKLDGDARGGAMLSVVEATSRPVKLIGTGEALDGLDAFHPDRMASRILGMGDVMTLVERAQQAVNQDDTLSLMEKFKQNQFNFNDFMKLQKQLKWLGSMEGILNLLPIPGLSKELKSTLSQGSEQQQAKFKIIIDSMTRDEREHPDLMSPRRIGRIAKGCGMTEADVNAMVTQFNQMRWMMQQMSGLFGGNGGLGDWGEGGASGNTGNDEDNASHASEQSAFAMPSRKLGKSGKPKANKQQKQQAQLEALMKQYGQPGKTPKLPPGFPKFPGF
ncbi:MAG: signal recognition particle receptor subunit alpha [Vampirovibrionales bacterium]|nr:signal recognition particle receptor subunit alpha [Vampirovibrionales bacterium]